MVGIEDESHGLLGELLTPPRERRLRSTQYLLAAREDVRQEGNGMLQLCIDADEALAARLESKAAAADLSRRETYDLLVSRRRRQAAEKGTLVGHATVQVLPFERLDEALAAKDRLDEYWVKEKPLTGLWNIPARARLKREYEPWNLAEAAYGHFRTEQLGMPPYGELAEVYEENTPGLYDGLFTRMEQQSFLEEWRQLAPAEPAETA